MCLLYWLLLLLLLLTRSPLQPNTNKAHTKHDSV
jgi:hypothetical protein